MNAVDHTDYDESGYFEAAPHLLDPKSSFQRYRVARVLDVYTPGPSERVVDLGCGWGTFSFALAPRVREVVGVDFSERSIELCERRLEAVGLSNVRFIRADAAYTGLEGGAWDYVLAADLVEHLYPASSAAVAREAFRLLRPGGRFGVWTPHRGHLLEILKSCGIVLKPDPTHVDYKSMERLRELFEQAGFGIERSYYAESHVPVLKWLERALLRWVPLLRRRIAMLGQKRP